MTYSIPPTETLAETKTCKHCGTSFPITDKDLEFYDRVSPIFSGKKYPIPTPTLCPDCRLRRRLSFRNESKLYKRNCDATGKSIISAYSPDKPFKTYHQEYWWSDQWDPLSYGRDFDFNRPFFEQFAELQSTVPRITVLNGFSENADYGNHSYYNKDSYSVYSCGYVQNSLYCVDVSKSSDCVDCGKTYGSSHCYECVESKNCTNCQHSFQCEDCFACYLCVGCVGCKNCIGCKNLLNQEYAIGNETVSKEVFQETLERYSSDPAFRKELRARFDELRAKVPTEHLHNRRSENLFQCDNCDNCADSKHCFNCEDSKNIAYSYDIVLWGANDCYDYTTYGEHSSRIYEVQCSGMTENVLFSNVIWGGNNVFYCDNSLNNSHHCFGCVSLRGNVSYCILNKQYSKEEYEALVPKIIEHMTKTGEWGEFFPSSLSPFGYNETVAQEYFPMTREQILGDARENRAVTECGPIFRWSDYESPFPKVEKTIPASKLPERIEDIPDDILNWAIECEVTGKLFRVIKQELEFYRKHRLSVPRRHPDRRHLDRLAIRNPRKTFERQCSKCHKNIFTTFAPERPEKIYCETCYAKETVG